VDPDAVVSSYAYTYCDQRLVSSSDCFAYKTTDVEVTPLVPPFSYNNLCSSVVLTNYIPVFIFVYSIQLLVPMVYICFFTSTTYPSLPNVIKKMIHGVFWPQYWRKDAGSAPSLTDKASSGEKRERIRDDFGSGPNCAQPNKLLKADRIISSDILNHLLLFFTFGLCSPFLSLAIVLAASLKQYMWVMLLGRFLDMRAPRTKAPEDTSAPGTTVETEVGGSCSASESGWSGKGESGGHGDGDGDGDGDDATVALSIACIPILEKVTHCVWPIIWTSSLFFAFLIWDILGDAWDWSRSVWAPLLTLSVPAGVWVYSFARAHWCSARGHVVGRSASDANMISMGGMEKASSMKNEDHRIGAPVDSTSNPLQEGAENAAR
jgi:hypothetical protein